AGGRHRARGGRRARTRPRRRCVGRARAPAVPARVRRRAGRSHPNPRRPVGRVDRPGRARPDQRRARRAPRTGPRRDAPVDAACHRRRIAAGFVGRSTFLVGMAKNPDPTLPLSTITGVTRTLDDWTTMFHMVLVVLPDRLEGAQWVPIAERIFATFGDSDAKVAFLVPGPAPMAERLLEQGSGKYSVFLDPDRAVI